MFNKIKKTAYPPTEKPVLVWDGECGFCKYWVTRWKQNTGVEIDYIPYQKIAAHFKDIPLKEFKKASRLIDLNGNVYSGPDSAYASYTFGKKNLPFHSWYKKYGWFTWLSDHGYNFIAKHRSTMFKITTLLFGKDPLSFKLYWLFFIILIILILILALTPL